MCNTGAGGGARSPAVRLQLQPLPHLRGKGWAPKGPSRGTGTKEDLRVPALQGGFLPGSTRCKVMPSSARCGFHVGARTSSPHGPCAHPEPHPQIDPAHQQGLKVAAPRPGKWRVAFDSDAWHYGGKVGPLLPGAAEREAAQAGSCSEFCHVAWIQFLGSRLFLTPCACMLGTQYNGYAHMKSFRAA